MLSGKEKLKKCRLIKVLPWFLSRVVHFVCFGFSKDCSTYIFMLTKQNSLILKIEILCFPKRRRNQRCCAIWKHKTRSSFEKYPQRKSANFYQVLITLAFSIHKLDLSDLHFKKFIFPFSYLASGGGSNIVYGSAGL